MITVTVVVVAILAFIAQVITTPLRLLVVKYYVSTATHVYERLTRLWSTPLLAYMDHSMLHYQWCPIYYKMEFKWCVVDISPVVTAQRCSFSHHMAHLC